MKIRLAVIVEGHGEVESVPILIRRIVAGIDSSVYIDIIGSIRKPANQLKRPGELERAVDLAARKIGGRGGILILLDCDGKDECPKTDAPVLLSRACAARSDLPVSVVLAYKEYEAWFIAAAESLRGKRRLSESLEIVADPENIRGAKEWLSRHMPRNDPYSEVDDQPAFTAEFDMQLARRANSFDKCYRDIVRMVEILRNEL